MKHMFRRIAPASGHSMQSQHHLFAAPVRGWVRSENFAMANPAGAYILDNWFPTPTGIRLRAGTSKHATLGGSGGAVSLFNYVSAGNDHFFGASDGEVYDITSPADPDVAPSAEFNGQSNGYYSFQQFPITTTDYMYAVNGEDLAQLFDGTSWTQITAISTPALTGVTTDKLDTVWSYRNRLIFTEVNSMVVWYLPVDSIGGALSDFTLAGIFQRGGSLKFGATWSLDAGDGVDDKCVFVSTEGEVAVFEGADPSSATDWRLVGRYDMAKPLGKKAFMRAGGELLVLTEEGILPISAAITKDKSALSMDAISHPIEPVWTQEVFDRSASPWEIIKWSQKNMALISQPVVFDGADEQCLVINLHTGAWCRFTGWNTECLGLHDDRAFYGNSDGYVYECEVGGSDAGTPYTAVYVGLFDHLSSPGRVKVGHLMRSTFLAGSPFTPKLSISTNYRVFLPAAPSAASVDDPPLWDAALWDTAHWDGGFDAQISTRWRGVHGSGFAVAPQLQVTQGSNLLPSVELVSLEMLYDFGGVVV